MEWKIETRLIGKKSVAIGSDVPVGEFTDLSAAKSAFLEKPGISWTPKAVSDRGGPTHIPEIYNNHLGFEVLGEALLAHFTDEKVKAFLGGNAWRSFEYNPP